MTWVAAVVIFGLCAAGVYLLTSRDLLRITLGMSFLGSAMTLLVIAAGRLRSGQPPVIRPGASVLEDSAPALPQALALTAVVIGFALLCFALALVHYAFVGHGTEDADSLRDVEPTPGTALTPAVELEREAAGS